MGAPWTHLEVNLEQSPDQTWWWSIEGVAGPAMGYPSREAATIALRRALLGLLEGDIPNPRAAFEADLELAIERFEELHAGLLAECREHGAAFTPWQSGKWEGSFLAVRALLTEYLLPMRDAWRLGGFFSRKGEKLAGREG